MFREIDPIQSFEEIKNDARAVLVDCRTAAEWHLTGIPDLSSIGKQPLFVAIADESGRPNPDFVQKIAAVAEQDTPVHVICRIGGRSANACRMLANAGYTDLVNVLEGFEGRANEQGHRNSFEGWKYHNLPWRQS